MMMKRRKGNNPNNQTNHQTLVMEFKHLCRPRIAKLFNLLETNSTTGERQPITAKILANEVLPVCVTARDTALIQSWVHNLEHQAHSLGLETIEIPRKTFYNRLHRDMFAPLLVGIVEISEIAQLTSTFEDVICSVERNQRWCKLKERFTLKEQPTPPLKDNKTANNRRSPSPPRHGTKKANGGNSKFDEDWSTRDENHRQPKITSPPGPLAPKHHHRRHHSYNVDWTTHRHRRTNLHKKANHLMSTVRVWSYDAVTQRAKTVTSHQGDHISRVSIQTDKLVALLSNGKMEETSIHLALLSKAKAKERRQTPLLRRYNSVVGKDLRKAGEEDGKEDRKTTLPKSHHLARSTSSHTLRKDHDRLLSPSNHTMHDGGGGGDDQLDRPAINPDQYPERTGLGVSCSALFNYDIQDVSASDTQAAMLVKGQLYTWGHEPSVLGHPPLPVQNTSMKTPAVDDVIHGATNRDDYLQQDTYDDCYKYFLDYHEELCEQAGLMKEGFDSTWLEYPEDADQLWKSLQQQWYIQMYKAGPRLVTSMQHRQYTNIVKVACGSAHSLAVDAAGHLIAWGINNFGCLGLGDRVQNGAVQLLPTHVRLSEEEGGVEQQRDSEEEESQEDKDPRQGSRRTHHHHHASHAARYNIKTIAAGGC